MCRGAEEQQQHCFDLSGLSLLLVPIYGKKTKKSVIRHLQAKPVNNELAITKSKLNLHKSFDTKKVKVAYTQLPSVVFRS